MKKTLIIGASLNSDRYSYKAMKMLTEHHHPVIAIGNKIGTWMDIDISTEMAAHEEIDTVTLYVNQEIQKKYYDYIISLHPKRVIFNPGTENTEFEKLLSNHQIEVLEACTLVLLSTNQY